MLVSVKSVVACTGMVVFAAASTCQLGCSDPDAGSGGGSSGGSASATAGSASGGTAAGGSAAGEGPCRAGMPTDAAALFQKLAGTYGFPAREKACDFESHSYVAPNTYQVTVSASSQTVQVSTSAGMELFAVSFNAMNDVACKDEFAESFVLNGGSDTVRVSFLNGEFSSVSFGQCWFVAD